MCGSGLRGIVGNLVEHLKAIGEEALAVARRGCVAASGLLGF